MAKWVSGKLPVAKTGGRRANPTAVIGRLPSLRTTSLLTSGQLSAASSRAAAEILQAGSSLNTDRSYRTAMRYWAAWHQVRFGMQSMPLPLPAPDVVQFIVDHFGRPDDGERKIRKHELPPELDQLLVNAGCKAKPGPFKLSTLEHRIAVLSKIHKLRGFEYQNPCRDPHILELLKRVRRVAYQITDDVAVGKSAATLPVLNAMIATCEPDGLIGLRDKAILLFGFGSGGRRRSEIAGADLRQFTRLPDGSYEFLVGASKGRQERGKDPEIAKPVNGRAAAALSGWLRAAGITEGPVFRRVFRTRNGGKIVETVGDDPLGDQVIRNIVKKRAKLAGVEGDWGAHSLRSGYVTEAIDAGANPKDVMTMTDHRSLQTMMKYVRKKDLRASPAANLLVEKDAE